jgi:hypothetical protein
MGTSKSSFVRDLASALAGTPSVVASMAVTSIIFRNMASPCEARDLDVDAAMIQSKKFADALGAAGKTYEFYTLPGEIHGFTCAANMQPWLNRLDVFLAKYILAD